MYVCMYVCVYVFMYVCVTCKSLVLNSALALSGCMCNGTAHFVSTGRCMPFARSAALAVKLLRRHSIYRSNSRVHIAAGARLHALYEATRQNFVLGNGLGLPSKLVVVCLAWLRDHGSNVSAEISY